MKTLCNKLALAICCQLFVSLAYAQTGTIKGKVLDRATNQPLPFASVYINSTTMGTFSDDRGEFTLQNIPSDTYDLIVSYIGHEPYQSHLRLESGNTLTLTIKLAASTLKEVLITGKRDNNWGKQLEKFKRLFLGTGAAANQCQLINPWSLTFADSAGIFTAHATDVLEIENLSLGYRVSYALTALVVSKDNFVISGFIRFRSLETTDTVLVKKWAENRMKAYNGSSRHFFKSAVDNRLTEERFVLYEDRSELKKIVRDSRFSANLDKTIFSYDMQGKVNALMDSTMYTIQMPTRLEVHYKNDHTHSKVYWDVPYPVSWIEVNGGMLNLSREGIVLNPIKMTLVGSMFESRIADALPNDYQPDTRPEVYQDSLQHASASALTYLIERPYLHTDKEYYYANEPIWFKGYMHYVTPALADSLSHVLYVDVLNRKGETVSSGMFPVNKGSSAGNLTLPSFVESGDYTLRAYTRWMLNFDPVFMFTKPIKVLGMGELARIKNVPPPNLTTEKILITSDKEQYDPREKIVLNIEVHDEFDQPVPANLSISVTDLAQAVPSGNETTILSAYAMPMVAVPDSLTKKARHLIQNGIDLKGTFIHPKTKSGQGVLTLIQENANLQMTFTTEKDGSFFLPNLVLHDTAKLSIASKTIKGKRGTVIFDTTRLAVPMRLVHPLQLEIYKTENPTRHYIPDFSKAQLLEAVTVKATRIEPRRNSVIMPDYSVTGAWMEERYITDVLSGIQRKIPGIRVLITMDDSGMLTKRVVMNGGGSFAGNSEPLLVIDDVVMNDASGGAMGGNVASMIESFSPSQIESVEVIKFGISAAYGARGGNGIIKIYTKRGNTDAGLVTMGMYDKSTLKTVNVPGFSETLKFSAPDYTVPTTSDIPDHRSTIFWQPLLSTNGKNPLTLSFFAADISTTYRIVVEGLTPDGKPVRNEKRITVKNHD